ncbi:MAG: helix-turn-helix domain-containing protein [Isosphaeraceae bacterium]
MSITEVSLADRLQEAMAAAELTPSDLARRSRVPRNALYRWLKGEKAPSRDQLDVLAAALQVDLAWLVGGNGRIDETARRGGREDCRSPAIWGDFRRAPQDGGRDFGNSNVWSFGDGLDSLVREILQNSRDAAATADRKVEVIFRVIRLSGADKQAYLAALEWDALEGHLEASASGGQKLGALLLEGLDRMSDRDLLLLVVEDWGTVGLTGPERGTGHFTALCRNNLDSNKDGTAGGAFGLGKAVLWRASRLATVLVNSHLSPTEDGRSRSRIIGRCELAWHRAGDLEYAGPGWFGRRESVSGGAVSIWDDDVLGRRLYLDRQESGTSICVVGFHDAASDGDRSPELLAQALVRAAAEHFFPAIVAEKLAVRAEVFDGRRPYDDRVPSFTADANPDEFTPAYVRMLRAFRAGTTVEHLGDAGAVASRAVTLCLPARTADPRHGEQSHEAVLLVAADEGSPGGDGHLERVNRLVMFRGAGMVVQDQSLQGVLHGGPSGACAAPVRQGCGAPRRRFAA